MPLVLAGATSGQATIQATDAATVTLTLPASTGTLVVTGGAQTIEFADGSAAAPSITNSGDTNTGMFFPAADTIAFSEGGTEVARFDSAGNFGMNTTAPVGRVESKTANIVSGNSAYAQKAFVANIPLNTSNVTGSLVAAYDGSTIHAADLGYSYDGAGYYLALATNDNTIDSPIERMRITSAGVIQAGNNSGTGEVFAQNTVKVWGVINAGSTSFYTSFGTSSISKISTGVFQIGFSRTLGSSRFGSGLSQYSAGYSFINNESTTLCRVNTTNTSNSAVDADVQFLISGAS